MNPIRAFVRFKALSVVLRQDKLLLGEVEEGAKAGDLRIAGVVKEGYLRVARFDGAAWRDAGGHWGGRLHKMSLRHAQRTAAAIKAVKVHEYFWCTAALLTADAQSRFADQQERERLAAQARARA